jgi:hypothetical protein
MVVKSENVLHGMSSICQYYGRSEPTVLKLHKEYGFPIRKDAGGWSGDRNLIDDWHKDYVAGRTERWLAR